MSDETELATDSVQKIADSMGVEEVGIQSTPLTVPDQTSLEVIPTEPRFVHYARGHHPNSLNKLKPFSKGDPRINRAGRPRTRDELRRLIQRLSDQPSPEDPSVSRLESMLQTMLTEGTASDREHILWYGFGRPALEIKDGRRGKLAEELSDEELAEFILEAVERRGGTGSQELEGQPSAEEDAPAEEGREST